MLVFAEVVFVLLDWLALVVEDDLAAAKPLRCAAPGSGLCDGLGHDRVATTVGVLEVDLHTGRIAAVQIGHVGFALDVASRCRSGSVSHIAFSVDAFAEGVDMAGGGRAEQTPQFGFVVAVLEDRAGVSGG